MKRSIWILLGVLVVIAVVWFVVFRPKSQTVAVDLIQEFPKATEKRPNPEAYSLIDASLAGVTKRAISVTGASRIAWEVTVPDNAWLSVSVGLTEQAWITAGDGVLFRISVNDDEIFNQLINPYGDPSARHWQDLMLDLSEYAGEKVSVYLKTNTSIPGHNDPNGDFAVFGDPRIVTR